MNAAFTPPPMPGAPRAASAALSRCSLALPGRPLRCGAAGRINSVGARRQVSIVGASGPRLRQPAQDPKSEELGEWLTRARAVDRVRVLPIRFSQDRAVDARALMGDAILKTYMLDHIFENEPPKLAADKSYLSRRLSAALSNDTMAKHASSTMPPDLADFLREMDASAHDIGTTTEAIVYEVRDNVLAVKQLASCLLKWSNSDMDAKDWKSVMMMLHVYGTIDIDHEESGLSHSPDWNVTATFTSPFRTVKTVASGSGSKKVQEQRAAKELLLKLLEEPLAGEEEMVAFVRARTVKDAPALNRKYSSPQTPSEELRSANTDVVILRPHSYLTYELDKFSNLYEGGAEPSQTEMEEWFHTKFIKQKSRFLAIMNAPYVFPEHIRSVKAWINEVEVGSEGVAAEGKLDDGGGAREEVFGTFSRAFNGSTRRRDLEERDYSAPGPNKGDGGLSRRAMGLGKSSANPWERSSGSGVTENGSVDEELDVEQADGESGKVLERVIMVRVEDMAGVPYVVTGHAVSRKVTGAKEQAAQRAYEVIMDRILHLTVDEVIARYGLEVPETEDGEEVEEEENACADGGDDAEATTGVEPEAVSLSDSKLSTLPL